MLKMCFASYKFNNLLVAVLMCLRDERADIRMAILELLHKLVTDRYTVFTILT
jgi:hypothetical protein